MKMPDYCFYHNTKTLRDELSLELIKELEKFSTDYEYIVGTLSDLKSDADKQQLLYYIRNGKDVNYSNIILYALELSQSGEEKS